MTKRLTIVQLLLCVVTIGCTGQSTSSSDTALEKGESRSPRCEGERAHGPA
jgi:hypothetical protein